MLRRKREEKHDSVVGKDVDERKDKKEERCFQDCTRRSKMRARCKKKKREMEGVLTEREPR